MLVTRILHDGPRGRQEGARRHSARTEQTIVAWGIRSRHLLAVALTSGMLTAVAAGCSTDEQRGADVPGPGAGGSPGGPASSATALVVVGRDGSGNRFTWQLTCDPVGGDHPDPDAACRVLADAGDRALPAVPKDRVCPQVYGGPETATVSGTWRGQPVLSTFTRTDGCQIARWKALVGLLPPADT